MVLLSAVACHAVCSQHTIRDVKVSRPAWSQDHFFGLGLGLSLIVIALGLSLGLI